jgi:hypothetical protein
LPNPTGTARAGNSQHPFRDPTKAEIRTILRKKGSRADLSALTIRRFPPPRTRLPLFLVRRHFGPMRLLSVCLHRLTQSGKDALLVLRLVEVDLP